MHPQRARLVDSFRRTLVLLVVLGLAVAQGAVLVPTASATAATASQPAVQRDGGNLNYVRDLDSPAVVRILNVVFAQVVCRGCGANGSDYTFPNANNPTYTGGDYVLASSGSGAFISSDGYVLTADHVVDQDCSDNVNLPDLTNEWENDVQQNFSSYGFASQSDATNFLQSALNNNLVSASCQPGGFSKVFPSSAYQGTLNSPGSLVSWNVTQVVQSSPFGQQDTAIIKVEPPHDMPYLTLATPDQIQTGEQITAIAYPGDADTTSAAELFNPSNYDVNTLTNLITPSIDTGQITAEQHDANGTLEYETSGIAYHGSSGGPAVDDNGNIVGFFDFTPDTTSNRVAVMIASSVAAHYAQQAGVGTPKPGSVEPAWTQAMKDFYATGPCHFGTALNDLQQIKNLHPEFAGVQSFYLTATQKQTPQACAASKQTASGPSGAVVALIILLVLLILGGVGAFFVMQQRRTRAPAPAMVSAGSASMAGEHHVIPDAPPSQATAYGQLSAPPGQPMEGYSRFGGPSTEPTMPSAMHVEMHAESPAEMPAEIASGIFTTAPQGGEVGSADHVPTEASTPRMAAYSGPVVQQPHHRMCVNGHVVDDPHAHFCPECGAAVQTPANSI